MPQATPTGPGAQESSEGARAEASRPAPTLPGTPEPALGLCGQQEPLRPQLLEDWAPACVLGFPRQQHCMLGLGSGSPPCLLDMCTSEALGGLSLAATQEVSVAGEGGKAGRWE